MTSFEELGLAGIVASLLFQLGKWAYRKWIVKDPNYDFHEAVYIIGIPTLAFFVAPGLAWLNAPGYSYPADWVIWVKEGLLTTLFALGAYYVGINPLRKYRNDKIAERNGS